MREGDLDLDGARALLASWGHPRPGRWLRGKLEDGTLPSPRIPREALWQVLLRDECDKLYNQAWCAYEQIRDAEDPESVWMIAMDDFPSAVEQAWALAPALASEHLELLARHRPESRDQCLRELRAGTPDEARERAACLAFWAENATIMTELRRTLYRLVREELRRKAS